MSKQSSVLLEVCVASVDDAVAACAGGADRLELNVAIELGGLTPSTGLLDQVRANVSVPVVAMVRPRGAGFRYTPAECRVMLRDADQLLSAGADGIVAGGLTSDGSLDRELWQSLRKLCESRELIFHRAFDVHNDQSSLLEELIDAGTDRVLTSGGASSAWNGRKRLANLQQQSGGRIDVLPGSGITAVNAAALVQATGCRQLHGTFRETGIDPAGDITDPEYPKTSQQRVAVVRSALDQNFGMADRSAADASL